MPLYMLLAGLLGAITWNITTWYVGLPTSSSHALIGGYGGAAIAAYGSVVGILKPEGWTKTIIFIVASPIIIGMLLGTTLMVAVHWILRRATPRNVDRVFRKGQLLSAAAYSLGHGGNDAAKDHGHHNRRVGIRRNSDFWAGGQAAGYSLMGCAVGPWGYRIGDVIWLEDCSHNGF